MSRTIPIYDAVLRGSGRVPDMPEPAVESPVTRPPAPLAGVDGVLSLGEIALVVGGSRTDRTAFVHHLALGAAAHAGRPRAAVRLVSTYQTAETIARPFAHAVARLPLGATASVDELEHAADFVSQLPIWIDEEPEPDVESLVARMTDSLLPLPISLHVVDDLAPILRNGDALSSIIDKVKRVAEALPTGVVLVAEAADHRSIGADVEVELLVRGGEIRPLVRRLLPLRRACGWTGFESVPHSDAAVIEEVFDREEDLEQ